MPIQTVTRSSTRMANDPWFGYQRPALPRAPAGAHRNQRPGTPPPPRV